MRVAHLAIVLFIASALLAATPFRLKLDGGQLRVAAAAGGFLSGSPLQQLRDGGSVAYVFRLSVKTEPGGRGTRQSKHRFTMSYDLWEERFAVTETEPSRRAISHLTQQAAETWCFDAIALPAMDMNTTTKYWAVLEYESEEPVAAPAAARDSAFSLSGLVDVFSRKGAKPPVRGSQETGPFILRDLPAGNSAPGSRQQ